MLEFCYIFKNSGATFEIENSIRIVKELYPKSRITVIGDKTNLDVEHIRYNQNQKTNRCSRVVDMLLILSNRYDDFILMYDDIFFSKKIEIENQSSGDLRMKRSTGYNLCIKNTIDCLNYFDKPIKNYDAHQPFKFNSKKVKELYNIIDTEIPHLPKSLYGNYFQIDSVNIDNLKVSSYQKAVDKLDKFGMFSSTDSLCPRTKQLIKGLPY